MSENWPIILIEGVLFGGGALLFGWWQLRSLRKERERDAEKARLDAAQGEGSTGSQPPES